MADEEPYVLGTDEAELERLRFQHHAWLRHGLELWERAGFRAGTSLVDLGCGPGFTSLELARIVGPEGRVVARDQSPRFLVFLRAELERLGHACVEPSLGPVEELDLPRGSFDGAYARWLFSWPPDPGLLLDRAVACVRPGGVLALQEYLDWGGMRLLPEHPAFARAVEACMQSWRDGGGTIDVARVLPNLAAERGLAVELFRPIARIGRVGSLEWRWILGFLRSYVPKLADRGLLEPGEVEAFLAEVGRREAEDEGFVFAPVMADLILRKA